MGIMFAIRIGGLRTFSLMVGVCLTPLAGCAVVDQYGSRAIEYNDQAATSNSSTILLNIMRAAYRQPFQFTDLSTVTGIASAQGSISASIPFKDGGPNISGPRLLTLNPAAQVSGGPQFNIANLNSQEFYQGLQTPLTPQVIALYAQSGVPLRVLLPLFISDIELDDNKADKKYVIHGSGHLTENSYGEFLSAIDKLVIDGLAVEPEPTDEKIGPPLTADKASDPRLLSGILQAMATASSGGGPSFKFEEKDKHFQLTKKGNKWHFCFLPSRPRQDDAIEAATYTHLNPKNVQPFHLNLGYKPDGKPAISLLVTGDNKLFCGSKAKTPTSSAAKIQIASNLKFTPRSVEGIFLFLGEMVRAELGIDSGVPTPLEDPVKHEFKANDPLRGPDHLFTVEPRPPSYGEISATLAGTPYTISAGSSETDASSQVVQILNDLLALQSSAKSLPAPNVVAVVP